MVVKLKIAPWKEEFKAITEDDMDNLSLSDQSSAIIKTLKDKRYELDTKLKKNWSWFVAIFISVWSVAALVILVLFGSSVLYMSDLIIVTLITTTLGNILGLSYLVVKHLFSLNK